MATCGPSASFRCGRGLAIDVDHDAEHHEREERPDDAEEDQQRKQADEHPQSGITNISVISRIVFQTG